MGSQIVITVGGTDVTDLVLFDSCTFDSQMGALPGTFELTVKDRFQAVSYNTGEEVTLDIDGTRLFGGYVTQVTEKFAIPADITADPSLVQTRQWVLRGVDYNILFDKRILRNTADFTHDLGTYAAGSHIGDLVKDPLCAHFIDIPAGFDTTSLVDAAVTDTPGTAIGAWMQQGSLWREQMEYFAKWGVVYYINANKQLYVREVEDSLARWMFSDKPNRLPIPVGYAYVPQIGFREGEFTEDGTLIINDAFVWGGGDWSSVVFARREDATSIAAVGRWETAETYFGTLKNQAQVNARASVIVDGTVSGVGGRGDLTRGYVNPQLMAKVTWFNHIVPKDPNQGNARAHLRPGDITTFVMYTLGTDVAHPLVMDLPLRSATITFPSLDTDGSAWVQFEGTFGLQLSDPWWLWKYLRDHEPVVPPVPIATSTDPGAPNPYGTSGQYNLVPAPDGSNKVFYLENGLVYVNGSTEIYVNGLRYFTPTNYTESDPSTGQITFIVAPAVTDQLKAVAVLQGSSGTPPTGSSGGGDPVSGGPGASTPPAVTHEYSGTGSGLQAFLDGVPDGAVVGLVANATYNLGTDGQILLTTRRISMDMREATIFRPNRGNTPIVQLQAACHDFAWYNGTILGVKPNDHKWDSTYEHEHGISLGGVYNFEFSNIKIRNVGGDGLYMGGSTFSEKWTADGRFHSGSITNCGRNAWSITDGAERVVVDYNNVTDSCYYVVDFEPNGYIVDGRPAGMNNCRFSDNVLTGHVYGDHVADTSQAAGYAFACTGSSISGPFGGPVPGNGFVFARNTFTTAPMKCGSFNNNITISNIQIIDNTSGGSFSSDSDFSNCVSLSGVTNVNISGNTQPIASGHFINLSGCSGTIVTSPNTN